MLYLASGGRPLFRSGFLCVGLSPVTRQEGRHLKNSVPYRVRELAVSERKSGCDHITRFIRYLSFLVTSFCTPYFKVLVGYEEDLVPCFVFLHCSFGGLKRTRYRYKDKVYHSAQSLIICESHVKFKGNSVTSASA